MNKLNPKSAVKPKSSNLGNIGKPWLVYIIPFVVKKENKGMQIARKQLLKESKLIQDSYSSNQPFPSNEIMKLLANVDLEVYSEYYRKFNTFQRYYLGKPRVEFDSKILYMDIVITFHANGFGNVLLIANFDDNLSYDSFMELLSAFQNNPQLKLLFDDLEVSSFFTIEDLLSACYSRKINRGLFQAFEQKFTFQLAGCRRESSFARKISMPVKKARIHVLIDKRSSPVDKVQSLPSFFCGYTHTLGCHQDM